MFRKKNTSTPARFPHKRGRGGVFPSPGMAEIVEILRADGGRVLDLGPADEVTLSFLGGCHVEVEVADLEPESVAGGGALPFKESAYRAILGWDLLFRVDRDRRVALACTMSRWLEPGGALFVVLPLEPNGLGWSYRFRILGPDELEYRPGRGKLAGPAPSNREVLALFPELACTGARILRHGAREFVLRRPGPE